MPSLSDTLHITKLSTFQAVQKWKSSLKAPIPALLVYRGNIRGSRWVHVGYYYEGSLVLTLRSCFVSPIGDHIPQQDSFRDKMSAAFPTAQP